MYNSVVVIKYLAAVSICSFIQKEASSQLNLLQTVIVCMENSVLVSWYLVLVPAYISQRCLLQRWPHYQC